MWNLWLPLALWHGPRACAGGNSTLRRLDMGQLESQDTLIFKAFPASSREGFREDGDASDEDRVNVVQDVADHDDPRFALYLRLTVFGELGDDRSEEAQQSAIERAEKVVFTTLVRSLFLGATGKKTGFKIAEKPIINSYVTPPYQLDARRPGGKDLDMRSPFTRSHFEFTFKGLNIDMLKTVTLSICEDYKRPQMEMMNSMLRALDAANSYPSDMLSVAARIHTGLSSIVHFMAGTIDPGGASGEGGSRECGRGRRPFKNDDVQGCFMEGGCFWDEPPVAPKPDEEKQMFAFFMPPCPENSEPDETGMVCKCSKGYDGEFHVVVEEGDQPARPTYVPAPGRPKSCTLVGGTCDVSRPHAMVLDDGSPAKGTVNEKANVKCPDGYIPSGEATCGEDGRWSPETKCTFLPTEAPPVPVCEVPRGPEYDTGSCEDCQGTRGKPWEAKCSCNVKCAEGFRSTGTAEPGDKTCKSKEYACPKGARWTEDNTCVDAQGSQTSNWCCDEGWGSTVPPAKLSSTASCASLTDHRSCMLAQDSGDGAPCCWRHEGFGDGDSPKCLPLSDSKLAEWTPTGSCAIEKFVPAASWEALPTCTKKCYPILRQNDVLPKDCDNCIPGDCNCTARCEKGLERFGGGPEHEMRDCQGGDHSMSPVAPVCFKPGEFQDPGRRRCGTVISTELLHVVEGCRECKAGKENCYCKASCPAHTKRVGGGQEETKLKCVSEEGHGVQVNMANSCEEIADPRQCANSMIRQVPSGRAVPCCLRSSGFDDDGGTICARQGSPLITRERRPEVCTERLESHWEPLPECRPLCDQGPLASAPHVEVSPECGDCIVGQEDCQCKVTCSPGYVRAGGGTVVGTRSCLEDRSYGDAPVCRKALPGETTDETDPDTVEPPEAAVAPICPLPHVENAITDGCKNCAAGDPDCRCRMRCRDTFADTEDPSREGFQECQLAGRTELGRGALCTGLTDEEQCLSSRDRESGTACCWRADGHGEGGKAACAPFGWKDMRYAPDRCAQVMKASFRPPECEPLCLLPSADDLKKKHVVAEDCGRCAAGKEGCKCKLTCEGDFEVLEGRPGRASCTESDRNFTLPTCVCPPDKADSCAKEQLRCEELSFWTKKRYGEVKGCGQCDPGDDCECEITCKGHYKLIGGNNPTCEKVDLVLATEKACKEISGEDECLASQDKGKGESCCFQESTSGRECVARSEVTSELPVMCAVHFMGKWTNLPVCKRKCENTFADRPDVKHEHCEDCASGVECGCNVSCQDGLEHYGGPAEGPKLCKSRGFEKAPVCGAHEALPGCPSPDTIPQVSPTWAMYKENVQCQDVGHQVSPASAGVVKTPSGSLDACKEACGDYGLLVLWENGRCDCCRSAWTRPLEEGAEASRTSAWVKGPLKSSGCSGCTAGEDCAGCSVGCADRHALVASGDSEAEPTCVVSTVARESAVCEGLLKRDCLTTEQEGQPCCWDGASCLRKKSPMIDSMTNLQCAPMTQGIWTGLPQCTPACFHDFREAEHVVYTGCDECIPGDQSCPCRVECETGFEPVGDGTPERRCSPENPKMARAPVCVKKDPLWCPSVDRYGFNLWEWWRGPSWSEGLDMTGCDCQPDQPCTCTAHCSDGFRLMEGTPGDMTCVKRDAKHILQEKQCGSIEKKEECLASTEKGEPCCWWRGDLHSGTCGLSSDSVSQWRLTGRILNPWRCAQLEVAEWEELPVCHHKCNPGEFARYASRLTVEGCNDCVAKPFTHASEEDCPCRISCDSGAVLKPMCVGDATKAEWDNIWELQGLYDGCKGACPTLDSQGGTLDVSDCDNPLLDGAGCNVHCLHQNGIERVGGAPDDSFVRCQRDFSNALAISQLPLCAPMCTKPDDQYGKLDVRQCSSTCRGGGQDCDCRVACKGRHTQSGGGAAGKKRCRLFPGNDTVAASAGWVDADPELEDHVTFTLTVAESQREAGDWELIISDALGYTVLPSDVKVDLDVRSAAPKHSVRASVRSGRDGKQVEATVKDGQLQAAIGAALITPGSSEMPDLNIKDVELRPAKEGWNQLPECLPPVTIEVVSAVSGNPIEGADISIYPDPSCTPGTELLTSKTSERGSATMATSGDNGYYRVEAEGFATDGGLFDRNNCQSQASCTFKLALSPTMSGGELDPQDCSFSMDADDPGFQMRAVLTWNNRIQDLDLWARSQTCARDITDRYGCRLDETEPGRDCRRLFQGQGWNHGGDILQSRSSCIVRTCSSECLEYKWFIFCQKWKDDCSKIWKNPLPQWVNWYTRKVDKLNPDRHSSSESYLWLDVDERNGYGPETVTFMNVPPGMYQVVVDTYDSSSYLDVRDASPMVTLYIGKTSIPFKCTPDPSCDSVSKLWNVVNIIIEEVQGDARSRKYRIRLKDSRSNMEPLHELDLPTTDTFSVMGGGGSGDRQYNSEYIKNVCYGQCEVAPGFSYDTCVDHGEEEAGGGVRHRYAFHIWNAGDARLNGAWEVSGEVRGRPRYTKVGDSSMIMEWSEGRRAWRLYIDNAWSIFRDTLYTCATDSVVFPTEGWKVDKGPEPPPTVVPAEQS